MALLRDVNLRLSDDKYSFLRRPSMLSEGYGLSISTEVEAPRVVPHVWAKCKLPESEYSNFSGIIQYSPLLAGRKYYRCVGVGSRPAGCYWTDVPICTIEQVRLGLAVKNQWNGDHGVVVFTPTKSIAAWRGRAAPQRETGRTDDFLPGGEMQYWVDTREFTDKCGSWEIFELSEVSRGVSLS
jgi:hypothetical protein